MSKLGEKLFYDIQELYIEGLSAKAIAAELNCSIELVLEQLEEIGVADSPQEDYDPFQTINS
jgi:orotate phosphoribosyltransferase-like protein